MTTQSSPRPTQDPTPRVPAHRPADPPMVDMRVVAALLEEHPQLHVFGYGKHPRLTVEPAASLELLTPGSRIDIAASSAWIAARLVPAPRRNRKQARSTYALKHWMQRETGLYVFNGAFISAVLLSHISADLSYFNPLVHATLTDTMTGGSERAATNNTRR